VTTGGDPERPLNFLQDVEHEPTRQFMSRVRGSIDRRRTTAQAVNFSWNLPQSVFLELARFISQLAALLGGNSRRP
jgi:hypothetical protein